MSKFTKNQTSASFLIGVLENRASGENISSDDQYRYELGFDVYIKARSYAILNKIAFWLAFIACLSVLFWPFFLILVEGLKNLSLIASAITQTMVTAVASFFILIYKHYKDRQTAAENLLRSIVFGKESGIEYSEAVIVELAKIDKGFSFNHKHPDQS